MSRMRMLIISFWVFVVVMLLWQFYTYNERMTQQEIDHPQQQHFYFYHTNGVAAAAAPARADGADVEQVGYTVQDKVPTDVSFTIQVTLKNIGNAKATGVQVHVRPYRGMRLGDEDAGHSTLKILDENDPLSQYGEWVTFPNLAPGESSTQSVVFLHQAGATPVVMGQSDTGVPGQAMETLKPEITFETEKPAPAPPHKAAGD